MDIKEKCTPTDQDDPGLFKESYVDSTKSDCGNPLPTISSIIYFNQSVT